MGYFISLLSILSFQLIVSFDELLLSIIETPIDTSEQALFLCDSSMQIQEL